MIKRYDIGPRRRKTGAAVEATDEPAAPAAPTRSRQAFRRPSSLRATETKLAAGRLL